MKPIEIILCVVVGFQVLTTFFQLRFNKAAHDIARLHQERLDRIEHGKGPK